MKIYRIVLLIGFLLVLGPSLLIAQKNKEKESKVEDLIELIESKNICIEVHQAIPISGPLINLNTPYRVEIKGDTIISQLPFFGRAYSIPYGGGEGLDFTGELQDYTYKKEKKDVINLTFNTKSKDDFFKYRIHLYPNGSGYIDVQPTNRQSISFRGEVKFKDDF